MKNSYNAKDSQTFICILLKMLHYENRYVSFNGTQIFLPVEIFKNKDSD